MKKVFIYILLLSGAATQAYAQKDADAKTILSDLSKKYRSYTSVKTDFSLNINNQQAGINETQTGSIISKTKDNKFHLSLYRPQGPAKSVIDQEIISDGKTQWTYNIPDKEVQVADAGQGKDGFNPAQIFTLYENGYKYVFAGTQKLNGKVYQVVDLSPEDAKSPFFKIRMMVDKVKKQLYSILVFDRNGSKYNYTFKTITPNVSVADGYFSFDPKSHPGVEVVDLR
ncbi:LolA-like putative outer membrane lipoprotein chaperone [Mucilaginibacter gynuensis]|uniref:LolA-like putative outer membrane lipoprotein chaperone n=1 Tax=Mucilaginibacter gynuensis TaxID=1302236 RepID=A0ABP8HKJ9_9SPHI